MTSWQAQVHLVTTQAAAHYCRARAVSTMVVVIGEADGPAAGDPGVEVRRTTRLRWRLGAEVPGLALAVAIATAATVVGRFVPVLGGPVSGIVIGVAVAALVKPGDRLRPGVNTASKFVLQLSVVVLGSQLSLSQIARVGGQSLPVMLGTLAGCLVAAYVLGRWLGIVGDLRTLIGVGTGICGASAIAAVTPVIGAIGLDVTYAISTIFLFNIAAVVTFPVVGHLLGMSQHAFGLFAGTAVNDMSSVVAASTTYGTTAANYAVVVKLVRTLMIIPVSLGLATWAGRRAVPTGTGLPARDVADSGPASRARVHVLRLVPWFLVAFLLVAAVNTFGLIPAAAHAGLSTLSVFLITVALSAIGLTTDVAGFRRAGAKPLLLGALLWILVSLTSLALQYGTGLA
ncbi:MAG: YeiH family protein [Jatrophihabitans sp.]|uniref:YeiH family protein n=1 Tax=Jatrophihabitans sp. TaxID=1932789 RepID=UPI003F7D1BE3